MPIFNDEQYESWEFAVMYLGLEFPYGRVMRAQHFRSLCAVYLDLEDILEASYIHG